MSLEEKESKQPESLGLLRNKETSSTEVKDIEWNKIENSPFATVKIDKRYHIVMGTSMMSNKQFKTRKEAENYVETKPWEIILTAVIAITELNKK